MERLPELAAGTDVFFLLMGSILVFSMHGGFAFLEAGTVRHKNQVNALSKILVDLSISALAYFIIGYWIAYGVGFFVGAETLSGGSEPYAKKGFTLIKFFFYCMFAAAVPAIISGGIAERAKFWPQCIATGVIVALVYPFFEGIVWNSNFDLQKGFFEKRFGAEFHDFAGSIVVHAVGGWLAFGAVRLLGARHGRYDAKGKPIGVPPSSIPWLALGSWMLCIGWFGFNVMSAAAVEKITGLVAMNSLMAMAGGVLAALYVGRNDPGFVHNGALAGLVAVCAGSDVMHPWGALAVGAVAGIIFVYMFEQIQNVWKMDDVLGVWPLHGLCGLWGGIACGIFGQKALGGMGGVSFAAQLTGSVLGAAYACIAGYLIYGAMKQLVGIRMSIEEERLGADLAIHKISATPEADMKAGRM
jgi:Amt family ammonium transporter